MHRIGLLEKGQQLWVGGSSRLNIASGGHEVTLSFRVQVSETRWVLAEQTMKLRWSSCGLGGRRPWFACDATTASGSRCGRRVALIYLVDGAFACRQCHKLAYSSQNEMPMFRDLTQAQKLRRRLGGSDDMWEPFPGRPKGMHRRTYQKWLAKGKQLEDRMPLLPIRHFEGTHSEDSLKSLSRERDRRKGKT